MKKILTLFLFFMATSAHAEPLQRLYTDGNLIKTRDGDPVSLRGVSLCSLDWHKPLSMLSDIAVSKTSWPMNVVRLPVQAKEWRMNDPHKYMSQRIDPAVQICKKAGLYCIIDWHEIAPWDDQKKIKTMENFWKIVAPRYAKQPHILYEIFNEPTTPKSKTEENWIAWRKAAQKWVDDIRKVAPDTLLLIGSPHWSQMTGYAEKHPFNGKNLVYTAHVYPQYQPKSWDNLFGDAAKKVPVFVTEWGWTSKPGGFDMLYSNQDDFGEPLRAYLDERPYIHWTAWSYDPKCGPAMLGQDKDDMGKFVQEWLQDIRKAP